MCLSDLENLTFSIPIFRPIFHPSVYHFRKKSTQFFQNSVLFTTICSKYTQFIRFGLLHLWWKTHRSLYQISWKSTQKAGTYTYTMSMRGPPRGFQTDHVDILTSNQNNIFTIHHPLSSAHQNVSTLLDIPIRGPYETLYYFTTHSAVTPQSTAIFSFSHQDAIDLCVPIKMRLICAYH